MVEKQSRHWLRILFYTASLNFENEWILKTSHELQPINSPNQDY